MYTIHKQIKTIVNDEEVLIDSGMKKIIDCFNSIDNVTTIFSCKGKFPIFMPYICFTCDNDNFINFLKQITVSNIDVNLNQSGLVDFPECYQLLFESRKSFNLFKKLIYQYTAVIH